MTLTDPNAADRQTARTEVGSVFVSNYPPYSFWRPDRVPDAISALGSAPEPGATLGLYLHIPFCRMRCKFCYFKVYTDKDGNQVRRYLDAMAEEVRRYSEMTAVRGRPLEFIYFGGGTPSFISSLQLRDLAARLKQAIPWDGCKEVTFECEPGTLTEAKLEAIREIGVSRLSLGVEHFDDKILQENGRAHLSAEIYRCLPWIRAVGFEQMNIDLIAGMVGETWDTWRDAVRRTIDLEPDSVTIYQMELPFNTVYSSAILDGSLATPVADWPQKRAWHNHAIEELAAVGYTVSSAYTMVKSSGDARFIYRDAVWHGTDMIGAGVASFGHISGIHVQNCSDWDAYLARLDAGDLPLARAFRASPEERWTRELILQLKLGRVEPAYFREKFQVDIMDRFRPAFDRLRSEGMLDVGEEEVTLTREGLLQVDGLLREFLAPEYRNSRYT